MPNGARRRGTSPGFGKSNRRALRTHREMTCLPQDWRAGEVAPRCFALCLDRCRGHRRLKHRPDLSRFQVVVDGHTCVADYELAAGVMTITHTGVDPSIGGRGIAGAMVQAALAHARSEGLKVNPLCSYARVYMQRHPETLDLMVA